MLSETHTEAILHALPLAVIMLQNGDPVFTNEKGSDLLHVLKEKNSPLLNAPEIGSRHIVEFKNKDEQIFIYELLLSAVTPSVHTSIMITGNDITERIKT